MSNSSLQAKIKYNSFTIWEFNSENIIQLKDGSILLFTSSQILHLNKIFNITILIDFKGEYSTRSIKQLKNDKILVCNKNLYELDIKGKTIKTIYFSEKNMTFYDIIQLKNGEIIGITDNNIVTIELKDDDFHKGKFNHIYKIPGEFKLHEGIYYNDKNYSNLYLLEGNKLLVHSFRAHNDNRSKCGNCRRTPYYSNIIFAFNLDTFEIIHKFNHFNNEINIVDLKKYICISYYSEIYIYDINDFKKIKEISLNNNYYEDIYIFKYNEDKLIVTTKNISNNKIAIFDLSNINDIQFSLFINNYNFAGNSYLYSRELFKNKLIYKLNDSKILINIFPFIFIFELPKYYEFQSFDEDKNKNILNNTIKDEDYY